MSNFHVHVLSLIIPIWANPMMMSVQQSIHTPNLICQNKFKFTICDGLQCLPVKMNNYDTFSVKVLARENFDVWNQVACHSKFPRGSLELNSWVDSWVSIKSCWRRLFNIFSNYYYYCIIYCYTRSYFLDIFIPYYFAVFRWVWIIFLWHKLIKI